MDEDKLPISKHLTEPRQCVLWTHPARVRHSAIFEAIEVLDKDSHEGKFVLRCRDCGQLYFYVWFEIVDWENGDDRIYRTYVPVRQPEEIEALKATDAYDLMRYFPRLQDDFGKTPIWRTRPGS